METPDRDQPARQTFVGAVGDDADAEIAVGRLREAGVDLVGLAVVEAPTGLAIITVAEDGENTIVVISGANALVSPSAATTAVAAMSAGDVLLMQGEVPRQTTENTVRAAVDAGHRVVLNVAPWGPLDRDVLTAADPLVLNEHEAALAVAQLGLTPDDDPRSLAASLVTAGGTQRDDHGRCAGAVVAHGSTTTPVPAVRVDAVDTTGAGDAFTGALAARLLAGDDLVAAARHAARVAGYAVQRPGAQPSYPSLEDDLP